MFIKYLKYIMFGWLGLSMTMIGYDIFNFEFWFVISPFIVYTLAETE